MKREEIIQKLTDQFNTEFSDNGYKTEFKPDGGMTQCNFGGLLIILGNSGESCLIWSDWSDDAISEELTECEIDYKENPDTDDEELESFFTYQETDYFLSDFMRIY